MKGLYETKEKFQHCLDDPEEKAHLKAVVSAFYNYQVKKT
jgi:hypothetical protein